MEKWSILIWLYYFSEFNDLRHVLYSFLCSFDVCVVPSVVTENVSTLFRASTLSTMLMDQFMKLTSSDYLRLILRTPITQIVECSDSCEVQRKGGRESGERGKEWEEGRGVWHGVGGVSCCIM